MDDSALKREVVIPPPRESAAAVALVSALALVGALATTAFAVRTRHVVESQVSCGGPPAMSSPSAEADFLRFSAAREDDAALAAWLSLPTESRMRTASHRELVARRVLARELEQNTIDASRGDCSSIAERFSRLKTLMPDQILPTTMAFCEP